MNAQDVSLVEFVAESNAIEGIRRAPAEAEVSALDRFLRLDRVTQTDLTDLVRVFQPDALLRDQVGLDVYVGNHRPPLGGPAIAGALDEILGGAMNGDHPYGVHHAYERLHPYTDGNGRSGRALWLWGMCQRSRRDFDRALSLGFLHCWYYESPEHSRVARGAGRPSPPGEVAAALDKGQP